MHSHNITRDIEILWITARPLDVLLQPFANLLPAGKGAAIIQFDNRIIGVKGESLVKVATVSRFDITLYDRIRKRLFRLSRRGRRAGTDQDTDQHNKGNK